MASACCSSCKVLEHNVWDIWIDGIYHHVFSNLICFRYLDLDSCINKFKRFCTCFSYEQEKSLLALQLLRGFYMDPHSSMPYSEYIKMFFFFYSWHQIWRMMMSRFFFFYWKLGVLTPYSSAWALQARPSGLPCVKMKTININKLGLYDNN